MLVIGAGFAGLTFAQKFPDGLARVTVVDRTNHHLFQPLLYQVATAGLAVPDIAQPVRSILSRKRDVTVLMDEATGFDLESRHVKFRGGQLAYDYLVLAMGGATSYFGHPEWARIAPGLKSIDDAVRIRREVLRAFELAEMTDDPEERQRLTTVVVIGGGATGVELAGACAELARKVLARDFRRLNLGRARVILIEGSPRLLEAYSPGLSGKAQRELESLGVVVRLGTRVQDIRPGEVVLAGETIAAANILWAAGVSASPLTRQLGAPVDRGGRLEVLPDLTLPGHPEVFALGDIVSITDPDGQVVPGISPAAMQMGRYAAGIIAREIRAKANGPAPERKPFDYFDKGMMATVGRSRAIARIGRLEFTGMPAWLLWLFVHLIFLVGFRNKLSVFLQWTYSYLTYKRGARVIYGFPAAGPPNTETPIPANEPAGTGRA